MEPPLEARAQEMKVVKYISFSTVFPTENDIFPIVKDIPSFMYYSNKNEMSLVTVYSLV